MHHYKVVNGKCRFYKTRARLAYEKASKSYRSHTSNVYKRNKNAVMITNDEKFIVGGNAFIKVDSAQNITTAFLSRMKSMMRDRGASGDAAQGAQTGEELERSGKGLRPHEQDVQQEK